MNISPKVFHTLSIVFWLNHAITRPGAFVMRGHTGYLHKLFKELAEEAEEKKWLRLSGKSPDRQKLTLSPGFHSALHGMREPSPRWNYDWDGQWYWLMFDIARKDSSLRSRLLRVLRREGFGLLQGSVWVTPFHPRIYIDSLERLKTKYSVRMCILSGEAIPIDGDMEPAYEAWDWKKIYAAHESYQQWLKQAKTSVDPSSMPAVRDAFHSEIRQWKSLATLDPFLPRVLWPDKYPGEKSWQLRESLLISWAQASVQSPPS